MATAAQTTQSSQQHQDGRQRLEGLKTRIQPALNFWQKINNDWVFNLSAMLAYNFLMSIFPLLLVLLAIAGFALGAISPESQTAFNNAIVGVLPSGTGQAIVFGALAHLKDSAGIVLAIGIVTAAYSGSRLFTTIESTFSVVFRLRPRDFLHQNIMAFCMLLLYIVLVPIIVLTSVFPSTLIHLVFPDKSVLRDVLVYIGGLVAGFLAASLLFSAIYVVVPNRPVPWREVWKGTLVAAALLVVYEQLFPIYQQIFLKPSSYGSWAGLAIVILVFFYYLGFILLLGAEVNSWAQGQRQAEGDIPAILHELQVHNTTRGAASPTAGQPQEDVEHRAGADAGDPGPTSQRPDTPKEERHPRRAEEQTTGKEKPDDQGQAGGSADGQHLEPAGAGSATSNLAASRRASDAANDHHPSFSATERESRKRWTFGSLAVTTGATLASLLLILRRRDAV